MARGVLGLDIGSHSIKIMELKEGKGGTWKLLKYGLHKLPAEAIVDGSIMNSAAVVEGIRDLVARHKIKTRDVSTCISGHSVIIKKITLPAMSEEELAESIQWEAEQYIPFSISDVNIDTQILSLNEDSGQMDVLLVAAKKDIIQEYTAVVQEAGLKPLIMDVASFTIENTFDLSEEAQPNEVVALVNIGASLININILNNGVTSFTRDINMGGNQFTEEIQKQLNVSYEEAEALKLGGNISSSSSTTEAIVPQEVGSILRSTSEAMSVEIQRSIDFYLATATRVRLSRVVVSGGTAKVAGLKEALESTLNVKVEISYPFRNITFNPKEFDPDYLADLAPLSSVVTGLAVRRLGDKPQ
ncbi:MAG: pilus assembly protein PilM [Deltaproteobacteria bacterium CG11_big_fil_rev_8_21_14_0_20_45_16]|nr:MAG: pilus assembly protein PilM [Deltaproteobacteria bacterium CG11_big_fil_rev_8_21_14_0_20_45_16]